MPRMIQSQPKVAFNAVVTYTDLLGRTHNISCRTRRQIKEAQGFLAQFKRDFAIVKQIAAQYAVKNGKFVNLYQLKRDLSAAGFNRQFVSRIVAASI